MMKNVYIDLLDCFEMFSVHPIHEKIFFKGKESQLWRWNGEGQLENKEVALEWTFGETQWVREDKYLKDEKTGKVLDISGAGGWTLGTEVIMWNKHEAKNQFWHLRPDNTGKFKQN